MTQTDKERSSVSAARIEYILAVCIYGSISILIRYTDFPSEGIALYRAILGALFIFLYQKARGQKLDRDAVKTNLAWLVLSGASLGLNWIFLFAAYIHTSISIASLINYTAPIIVVAIAPIVLHERLDMRKIPFIFISFAGVVLVSGVLEGGTDGAGGTGSFMGIIYACLASLTFVGILIFSRKMSYVPPLDRVFVQLLSAAAVILVYVLIKEHGVPVPDEPGVILSLLIVGSVYTALANILYFAGIMRLPVQAVAVLGYLESATAILISLVVFHEPMSVMAWAGAFMIISSAIISEVMPPKEPDIISEVMPPQKPDISEVMPPERPEK